MAVMSARVGSISDNKLGGCKFVSLSSRVFFWFFNVSQLLHIINILGLKSRVQLPRIKSRCKSTCKNIRQPFTNYIWRQSNGARFASWYSQNGSE